jgi:hypothetical protein
LYNWFWVSVLISSVELDASDCATDVALEAEGLPGRLGDFTLGCGLIASKLSNNFLFSGVVSSALLKSSIILSIDL